ncbi:hypothetical protein IE077_004137 [Cardiosporidium cionae]|uniref:Uncharacterized protein n=1 Tax=Cardiosporidium cionae TaxID=476202 RepID=A0ABQ7JE14_9APIC|nr:hypothetical protein IE077_004137 [Cardiosporidium cionae]|eukprot:KAF8822261.1 hypothetical protein IE077_004137 [Cardiosporidium cionae]
MPTPLSTRCSAFREDLKVRLDSISEDQPVVHLLKEILLETNVTIFNHVECLFDSYKKCYLRPTSERNCEVENKEQKMMSVCHKNFLIQPSQSPCSVATGNELVSPIGDFVVPIMQKNRKRTFHPQDACNDELMYSKTKRFAAGNNVEESENCNFNVTENSWNASGKINLERTFRASLSNDAFFTPKGNEHLIESSQQLVLKSQCSDNTETSDFQCAPDFSNFASHKSDCTTSVSNEITTMKGIHQQKYMKQSTEQQFSPASEEPDDLNRSFGGLYFHYVLRPYPPSDIRATIPIQDFLIAKKERDRFKEDACILKRDRHLFVYNLDAKGSYKYHEFNFAKPAETLKVQWVRDLREEHLLRQDSWNPFSIFGSAPPEVDTNELFPLRMYNQISAADRMKHPAIRLGRLELEWKRRTGKIVNLKIDDTATAAKMESIIGRFHMQKNSYQQWLAWFSRSIDYNEWKRISTHLKNRWKQEDEMDLNWKHDHLSLVEIQWLSKVMEWSEDKRDIVAIRQPCFCPAPNPSSNWGWNDRRHVLQNCATSRMSESICGPNLSLHRIRGTFKSPTKPANVPSMYFKSPFQSH